MMARMLDKVIRRNDVVDREALCIVAGQRVSAEKLSLHELSFFWKLQH
jgi:exosome complex RNA-binding protein Rrp42 (RNase PH superfamily)